MAAKIDWNITWIHGTIEPMVSQNMTIIDILLKVYHDIEDKFSKTGNKICTKICTALNENKNGDKFFN